MGTDELLDTLFGRPRPELKPERARQFDALKGEIRAFPQAGDLLRRGAQLRIRAQALQQKFRVPGNHHQQVVEVMSDSPGKPSHCFHFLRLTKLLLQCVPLRHVFGKKLEDSFPVPTIRHRTSRDADHRVCAALALPFRAQSSEWS